MATKTEMREEARKYVESIVREFCSNCPLVLGFSVTWKKGTNEHGGNASIKYTPEMFDAHFNLYETLLDGVVLWGFNKPWKEYILQILAHEMGHVYISELDGPERTLQKAASLVGNLFLRAIKKNLVEMDNE